MSSNPAFFTQCDVCTFQYILVPNEQYERERKCRQHKYRALVLRDTVLLLGAIQAIICGIAVIFYYGDSDRSFLSNFPQSWQNNPKTAYYGFGFTLFLALIGFVGTVLWCCNSCKCDTNSFHSDPYWNCYFCCYCCSGPRSSGYHGGGTPYIPPSSGGGGGGGGCGNCNGCDCNCGGGDCKCDGDAGAILLVVALVAVVLFALIGVLVGFFFLSIVLQRIFQRHLDVLRKQGLAKAYKVMDLSETSVQFQRPHFDTSELTNYGIPVSFYSDPAPHASATAPPAANLPAFVSPPQEYISGAQGTSNATSGASAPLMAAKEAPDWS